jgi:U6 snRNA-associated Sm-like protein LSm1
MFTTAAQLLDLTDSKRPILFHIKGSPRDTDMEAEKLMVALRDGRKLLGILRSWDQFGMSRRHVMGVK